MLEVMVRVGDPCRSRHDPHTGAKDIVDIARGSDTHAIVCVVCLGVLYPQQGVM